MTLHIVGHDGTERGDDALALARRLAALYEAELLALHVVDMPPVRDRFTGPVLENLEDAAGAVLSRVKDELTEAPGPEPRAVYATSPAAGLQQVCADKGLRSVIVGYNGSQEAQLALDMARRAGVMLRVVLAYRTFAFRLPTVPYSGASRQ